jgi:hypothetical protein
MHSKPALRYVKFYRQLDAHKVENSIDGYTRSLLATGLRVKLEQIIARNVQNLVSVEVYKHNKITP